MVNMEDAVIIRHADGSITVRSDDREFTNDLHIVRFPDGDILIRDLEDGEAIIVNPEQLNQVISVLDLLDEENEEEARWDLMVDEEDFIDDEDVFEWLRDAYEDGEVALTEEERGMFDPFAYADGEMDEYLV